jgi:hypothetical protein
MIDERVLDRVGNIVKDLGSDSLAIRIAVADDVARTLAEAGVSWSELVETLRLGARVRANNVNVDPKTLSWAYSRMWAMGPPTRGAVRSCYYHPSVRCNYVAEIRECRGPCACLPGLARPDEPSRWCAYSYDPERDGVPFIDGSPQASCFPDLLSAQFAVHAAFDLAEAEAAIDAADAEYAAYLESQAAARSDVRDADGDPSP